MGKILTDKQARFVTEYLLDLNSTRAAKAAGYSERTARNIGCENLAKPNIAKAIQNAIAERSKRTEIDADYVMRMTNELLERCMQKEPVLDSDGCPTGEWKFDSAGAARALKLLGDHCAVRAFQPGAGPPAGLPGDTKWVVEIVHVDKETYEQRLADEKNLPIEHEP